MKFNYPFVDIMIKRRGKKRKEKKKKKEKTWMQLQMTIGHCMHRLSFFTTHTDCFADKQQSVSITKYFLHFASVSSHRMSDWSVFAIRRAIHWNHTSSTYCRRFLQINAIHRTTSTRSAQLWRSFGEATFNWMKSCSSLPSACCLLCSLLCSALLSELCL